jgi:hypothetical protein
LYEKRIGSSTSRVDAEEIEIASARMMSLSIVPRSRNVMNGRRVMSGQCHR